MFDFPSLESTYSIGTEQPQQQASPSTKKKISLVAKTATATAAATALEAQLERLEEKRHQLEKETLQEAHDAYVALWPVIDKGDSLENFNKALRGAIKTASRLEKTGGKKGNIEFWAQKRTDERCDLYTLATIGDSLIPLEGYSENRAKIYQGIIAQSAQSVDTRTQENSRVGLILAHIGLAYIFRMEEQQRLHCNEALKLLRWKKMGDEPNNRELVAQTLICLGVISRGGEQIAYRSEALRLLGWMKVGDLPINSEMAAQALIGFGNASKGGEQLSYYKEALRLMRWKKMGDEPAIHKGLVVQALIGLGNASKVGEQLSFYNEALRLLEWKAIGDEPTNKELAAQALIGLGNAFRGKEQTTFYKEALELLGWRTFSDRPQNLKLVAQALIGLGNTSRGENQGSRGQDYYAEALKFAAENHDVEMQIRAHDGLVRAYFAAHEFQKANQHQEQGARLSVDPKDRSKRYEELGSSWWKNYKKSGKNADALHSLVFYWKAVQEDEERRSKIEAVWKQESFIFTPSAEEERQAVDWYKALFSKNKSF